MEIRLLQMILSRAETSHYRRGPVSLTPTAAELAVHRKLNYAWWEQVTSPAWVCRKNDEIQARVVPSESQAICFLCVTNPEVDKSRSLFSVVTIT